MAGTVTIVFASISVLNAWNTIVIDELQQFTDC